MATIPIKSIFGKLAGFTRATTTYPIERFLVPGGVITQALYMSTAAGSETAVNIQGVTDIETGSTGTAALATRGITTIPGGASTLYTLAAPPAAGIRKSFVATSTSTAVRNITSASHIIRGVSGSLSAGDSGIIVASSAHTVLFFTGLGQSIELVSLSTAAWACTSVSGYSSLQTPLTTA